MPNTPDAAARPLPDLQEYVEQAAARGELVVQPRMGMSCPRRMADGLRSVTGARATTLGTLTIDSYTRVEDIDGAAAALTAGQSLNGFPLVNHGPETTAQVVAAVEGRIPVQVRHGSARPGHIFDAMLPAGLYASEGGPVSYCLPYSKLPLAASVPAWADAAGALADGAAARGRRAHLETFGGCMLGQLCPPSLLIAISVLEAMFFAQRGVPSVSLSYAQQTSPVQDVEALAALRHLAEGLLPPSVDRHLVLYTYMGVFPGTEAGAGLLLDASARIAVRGGAQRLIVKTTAEAHRIPTAAENVVALERAARSAAAARGPAEDLPWAHQADYETVYREALMLVEAVLEQHADIGTALRRAFAAGILDIPFCLHRDNAGLARGAIGDDGRLVWSRTGAMSLPAPSARAPRITSDRLLAMLRHTADSHDRAAVELSAPVGDRPHRIAVVGSGPRGLAVAERLAARLAELPTGRPVEISLIDKVQVGAGRIWRTGQDDSFLMNTACGEVTMFSGPPDDGPARAGAGPSLGQWWASTTPACPGPNAYAPRAVYGSYLRFFLDAVEASLPTGAVLRRVTAEVVDLQPRDGAWQLTLRDGGTLVCDRVVLATGHPVPELTGQQAKLARFATDRPGVRYIRADSAADMPLAEIPPGARVGVIGLGLSFYDVTAALTTGRGGVFTEEGGALRYLPSGREPRIVAGSRSGVPVLARGRNQKGPDWRYRARLFTPARVERSGRGGPRDFDTAIRPWLEAEMRLVHHATAVRAACGRQAEREFLTRCAAAVERHGPESAEDILGRRARELGAAALSPLDLERLHRPFEGRHFSSPERFTAALCALLDDDIAQARLGNVDGPLKAALDVLRDVRGTLRRAVDDAGLTAASHAAFLDRFAPLSSFLAAGPPLGRLRQIRALMDAGVLSVVGPATRFEADCGRGSFTVSSPQVDGAEQTCEVLLDARVPGPWLTRDPAPLTRRLVEAGLWSPWVNRAGTPRLETGGVAVTAAPYHPVDARGEPVQGLYVLGIPTEGQRWFMQVGSARPGPWTEFTKDADAIAADALRAGAAAVPLGGGHRTARVDEPQGALR
ncbi:FAD/NAD(P)-binding protein [Streptomyces sp. NPDC001852]|uniref:FAD/NAD(P)-binding protein n=1 Tax=Streptomyces sp. NPDC001852 TaxID=3364619 RepID=UPI0036CF5D23